MLRTVRAEVTGILNRWPLMPGSSNPKDLEPYTRNHLLLLRANPSLPVRSFGKEDSYSKRCWWQVQYMSDIFWKRWLKEYLSTLQERAKWMKPRRSLVIENLVSMADENNHCGKWSLRKVIDVFHGKDRYVRSAKVQTSLTVLTRPVTKLSFLEGESAHWIQETVYLIQHSNRHVIRANVNKPNDANVCLIYDLKVLDLTFTISKTCSRHNSQQSRDEEI